MTMQVAALAAAGIAGIYLFSQQGKKKVVADAVSVENVTATKLPEAAQNVEIVSNESVVVAATVDRPIATLVVLPPDIKPALNVYTPPIIVPGEKPVAAGWSIELTNNMGQIMTGQGRVFNARVKVGDKDVTWTVDMVFYRPDGSMVYQGGGSKILLTPDVPGVWTAKIRAGGGGMGRQERDIPFRVHLSIPFATGLAQDTRVNNVVSNPYLHSQIGS
jgi:hypothetical protein